MSGLKFTYKLVLITALASTLVLIVFAAASFYVTKNSLEEQLTEYQVASARDLMHTIDRSLFTAHQGIQVLAQDQRLIDFVTDPGFASRSARRGSVSEHLESISLLTGPWRVVSLLDTRGNMLVSNMPTAAAGTMLDHPEQEAAFQAALDNRIYSSELRLLGKQNQPSLLFAAPVHRQGLQEAEIVGVVIGQYAWPVITQLLDSVTPSSNVRLLRDDGTVIGTRSAAREQLGSKALQGIDLREQGPALTSPDQPGEPSSLMVAVRQTGHLAYAGNDWLLVQETPYETLLAPVYTLARQEAVTATAGILLLCIALFGAGVYLTRPIGAMSRAVTAFSQGDLSARAEVASRDEIGELARSFNAMAEDIEYYIDQVKENSQEVRAFAYIVSHDLRGPLVNLKGFSAEIGYSLADLKALLSPALDALDEDKRAQALEILDEDVPEALRFIGSSVERMDGQIQAVLKLSRLGRRELTWEQVDCNALVKQVLATLQHQLEEKDVTVEVSDLPTIEADAFALEQVFGNLLDNAVKYMDGDAPGHIEVWAVEGRQAITFHVRDNGPGIDEANITKAFELFRRVGRGDQPGEGMGLAYVKTLVRRHGGRIWCESTPGEGSTFSFRLARYPSVQVRE